MPTDVPREKVLAALRKHKGVLRQAATELGLNRESLRVHVEREPELSEFRRNQLIDLAEERITSLAENAESEAVRLRTAQFILTTIGADRGWRKSKDVRLPLADLKVIHTAIEALINKFVPPDKREQARVFFRQKMREGYGAPQATGFRRIA